MSLTLISITTCNRVNEVKKYVWDYINFTNENADFHFLLSLDGDNTEYIEFCAEYKIPFIYSENQEGVGLSKNRVLSQFPDYDHYFFLDDDVELYDSSVFELVIKTALDLQLDHLCITPFHTILKEFKLNNLTIQQGNKGGGYFNYFSGKGLLH